MHAHDALRHLARPVALAASLLVAGGCDASLVVVDADAGPDAAAPQGSPARGDLVINEVAPVPGSGPDWLELHNRSQGALDLCDFFVTDALDRLDHYSPLGGALPPDPCPPAPLEAGGYLVVIADGSAAPGHARFRLGRAEEVHVVTTEGRVIDSLIYLYPAEGAGASLARRPDGQGLFTLAPPSPGAANPEDEP